MSNVFVAPQQGPTPGRAFAEGFSRGFENVTNANLQMKLENMQQQQKMQQLSDYNAGINKKIAKAHPLLSRFADEYNPMDPEQFMKLGDRLSEVGGQPRMNEYISMLNQPGGMGDSQGMVGGNEQPRSYENLPYQDRPALGENEMPPSQPSRRMPQPIPQGPPDFTQRRQELFDIANQSAHDPSLTKEQRKSIQDTHQKALTNLNAEATLATKNYWEAQKINKLSKEDAKWLDSTQNKLEQAENVTANLEKMKALRESGNIGTFTSFMNPDVRKAKAQYDAYASTIFQYFKSLFPKGLTQEEFKYIGDNWIPKSNLMDDTNEGREIAFGEMMQMAIKHGELLDQYQNPDGSYPKNIRQLVRKNMTPDLEAFKEKFGPPKTNKTESQKDIHSDSILMIRNSDGEEGYVPKDRVDEALKSGRYKKK